MGIEVVSSVSLLQTRLQLISSYIGMRAEHEFPEVGLLSQRAFAFKFLTNIAKLSSIGGEFILRANCCA